MTADLLARSARAASGLTQSELAARSKIAASSISSIELGEHDPTVSTFEALLLGTRHILVMVPTVRSDAAHVAAEIRIALGNSNEDRTFRCFIQLADNLAGETGATRVGLTLTEPAPTGSEHWDTALAALCEYRLAADKLPIPDWITNRVGNPAAHWTLRASKYSMPVDVKRVPSEFLRRGILVDASIFESV